MTKTIKLDDVATISTGNSAPQDEKLFKDGVHNFVRTSDVGKIHNGIIFEARDKLNDKGILKLKKFPKGTILFPKSGASTFLNHRVMLGVDSYVSSHLATIKGDNTKVLDTFLLYILQTIDAANLVADSGYPSLKTQTISKIEIMLPSILEQQRIVAKLNAAFAEIDKVINIKNKKINNIISLNKKIIDNHFLKFKEKILFDEIVLSKGTGLEKSRRLQSIDKTFPYLKMNNINKDNQINIKKFVSVDAKKEEIEKFSLKKGDFLFNTRNSTELVGKSAVFNEEGTWLFNNNILRVKFKPEFSSKFINFFLSTTLGKTYLDEMKTGTTNVAAIYYKNLGTLKIPLTTVETQEIIVNNIESIFNHTTLLMKKFNKNILSLESLKFIILSNELTNSA